MQPLLWVRIIIISKLIFIFDYFYFKPITLSLLAISSTLFFAESTDWQLLIIEALYYLTLTSFLNYRSKTNLKIEKMEEKQSANFAKARQVHQNSLPDTLPTEDDISMAAFYQPAEELGGDYYNVFKVDHGSMNVFFDQYFIYMFDVSGHGIDSAMLAIFINNTIEDYFKLQHEKGETVSPEKILSYIDKQYRAEEYPGDYLVCLLVGVLDLNSYEFTYSSSGFQFPFYKLSPDGNLVELKTGGLPISSSVEQSFLELKETTIDFAKNEMMFFTTDGLLEQTIDSGMYNNELKEALKGIDYFHPAALVESIKNDFISFTGSQYGDDDITYLSIGRLAGESKEWEFAEENEELINRQNKIISYLHDSDIVNSHLINTLQDLTSLIWQKSHKLSVKTLVNEDYLMISLRGDKEEIEWNQFLENNLDLTKLKEEGIQIFPCSKHCTKVYIFAKL